jgi:3,4-dihydroxy-2-butanone 4-phosphate synthase
VFPVRACDPPVAGGAVEAAIALATRFGHETVVAMATLVDDAGALVTGDSIGTFGRDHRVPIVEPRP